MQRRERAEPEDRSAHGARRTVLVENEDGGKLWAAQRILEAHGYDVLVCGGPRSLPKGRCPLVTDGRCPLAERADVVVNDLSLADPRNRRLLEAYRQHADTPVIVEISQLDVRRWAEDLTGCRVAFLPLSPDKLVGEVKTALGDPH